MKMKEVLIFKDGFEAGEPRHMINIPSFAMR